MPRVEFLKTMQIRDTSYVAMRVTHTRSGKVFYLIHKSNNSGRDDDPVVHYVKDLGSEEEVMRRFPCAEDKTWIRTAGDLGHGVTRGDYVSARSAYTSRIRESQE